MRFRPLHAALAIALAAAIGATAAAAHRSAPHGLDPSVAKRLAKNVTDAIAEENTALQQVTSKGITNLDTFGRSLSASIANLQHVNALAGDAGVIAPVQGALREDHAAEKEVKKRDRNVGEIKAMIEQALRFKWTAHSHLMAIANTAPTVTPTTPVAPKPAAVEACVSVENKGTSSNELVHILEPGGAGAKGTVNFNGQGVNQTQPFTLGSDGTGVVSFPVTTFGAAVITIDVTFVNGQVVSLSFGFTLSAANDGTAGCNPSTSPPGN